MVLEPIGIATLIVGLLTLLYGVGFGFAVFACTLAVGSAAAINLTAVGNSNIQPSHLLLVFILAAAILKPRYLQAALRSLNYPGPGFWFAGFVIYSALTGFFLPRIFAGATLVYSSARDSQGAASIIAVPLMPGSSNITQSVYLLGGLACFAFTAGLASLGRMEFIAKALTAAALTCLLLAVADLATFATGQQYLMDFLRNANYAIMTEGEISGFKRIVGAFPEASAYGTCALTLFCFVLMMTLERLKYPGVGLVTVALGLTVLLCTASTAYVAAVVPISLIVGLCIHYIVKRKATYTHISFLVLSVMIVPLVVLGMMIIPSVWAQVSELVETTLTSKLTSQSGEERMAWNKAALLSFLDTYGFGAGLGSVRTSSLVTALLSNTGIIGTLLFGIFMFNLITAVFRRRNAPRMERSIGLAALFSALTLATAMTISGTAVDLGLLFHVMAGLATGFAVAPRAVETEHSPVRVPAVSLQPAVVARRGTA